VLEIDAPKRLSYTWQDSYMSQPSIVIWTLTPVDGGTELQLEHRESSYTTPKLVKPGEIFTQQNLSLHETIRGTQTIEAIAPSSTFSSTHIAISQISESVIFHSLLNSGWNHKLERQLPKVLVSFTIDNQ